VRGLSGPLRRHRPGRHVARRYRAARTPADGAGFLDRLDAGWLEAAYAGDWPQLAAVSATARHLPDIALRYRTSWTASARLRRHRHPG
jgi:hypothetical protein